MTQTEEYWVLSAYEVQRGLAQKVLGFDENGHIVDPALLRVYERLADGRGCPIADIGRDYQIPREEVRGLDSEQPQGLARLVLPKPQPVRMPELVLA